MNIYTFRNIDAIDDFRAWLEAEVRGRYRFTRLTPRQNFSFVVKRYMRSKRTFHSEIRCINPWSLCMHSHVRFYKRIERCFAYKRDLAVLVHQFYSSYETPEDLQNPITVYFDSAADMVLCKMLWHDHNEPDA